jgi:putative membrane protein
MKILFTRFFQGFLIGFSDIVPGVSSTVLALLFGFYEDLLKLYFGITELVRIGIKKAGGRTIDAEDVTSLQTFDWKFLVALVIGYGAAAVSVSSFVSSLLLHYPSYVYATFFGIVVVSIGEVFSRISKWNWRLGILFFVSMVLAILPIGIEQGVLETSGLWLIVVGFLVSIGGVMPGFSGGFILLFFGIYDEVIAFLGGQGPFMIDFLYLGAGAALGYGIFARYVQRVYESYQQSFLAVMGGLITGSVWVLWPFVKEDGDILRRVYPWDITFVHGVGVVGLVILAILGVFLLKRFADRMEK